MFTGVGVDIRVDHAIIFGLSETAENLIQEGGRPMRGASQETAGRQGFAFFFHKGVLGKITSYVLVKNYLLESYCFHI